MKMIRWMMTAGPVLALLVCVNVASAQWSTEWAIGAPGRGWPQDQGPVFYVQEAGENDPPGDPNSPAENQQADDDYYFEGTYPDPIGAVGDDEIAVERAFAGTDNNLRFHFNLADTLNPGDKFRFSFEANNLDERADNANPRYGIQILVNDNVVMSEMVISPAELNTVFTTPEFSAESVGLVGGAGIDNVLTVQGINYSGDGGGNWMGIDYQELEVMPVPEPGTLGMMMAGLFWAVPIILTERGKRK